MKRFFNFVFALMTLLITGTGSALAQGWTFNSCDPAQGEVTSLKSIKFYYTDQSWADDGAAGMTGITLSDGTNNYPISAVDAYPDGYMTVTATQEITAPGTYTVHFPAGSVYNYSNHDLKCAEMSYTWTIKGAGGGDQGGELKIVDIQGEEGLITVTFNEDIASAPKDFFGKFQITILDHDGKFSTTPFALGGSYSGKVLSLKGGNGAEIDPDHHVTIDFAAGSVVGVSGAVLPACSKDITIKSNGSTGNVQAFGVAPSPGNVKKLAAISAEFKPAISEILDETLISIENEKGHKLPLIRISVNKEGEGESGAAPSALAINVDTDIATYQEGTTYKAHVKPGAIRCGDVVNDQEIVFGGWYVPISPVVLNLNPGANSVIPELSTVTVSSDEGELELAGKASDITITGIMEYGVNTYATCTNVAKTSEGLVLTFDKTLTPDYFSSVSDIADCQADKNNVKIVIPAGTFKSGIRTNNMTQAIYVIQPNVVLGEITITFSPADGSTVETLGVASTTEDENGVKTVYHIGIKFAEENNNLYVRIPDGSDIKILNPTGGVQKSFSAYDIVSGGGLNSFALDLSTNPITAVGPAGKTGLFTLVIPKESVFYYTDPNYYTEPIHPDEDIEASWRLKAGTTEICDLTVKGGKVSTVNILGQRSAAQKGVQIVGGKKVLR